MAHSPAELRLHPATLLFELFRHAKNFALPALAVAFGASRSTSGFGPFDRLPSGWELWLPLLILPAAAASAVQYLTFRLRFEERELVIRSGLLFRSERHIPFSRIQNVDAVENLVHRLFGVVEVRVETGGGGEEEAKLSVLPRAAFDEIRSRVFSARASEHPAHPAHPEHPEHPKHPLLHLPPRELLLYGLLENRGMVILGAGFGALWEFGIMDRIWSRVFFSDLFGRGFFRDLARAVVDEGPMPLDRLGLAAAGIVVILIAVRILSMLWAVTRLYDFRLTRVDEDLRTEYGLLTRVTATVPIRRVQTIHISEGPIYRWLGRASVRVATAGGGGGEGESGTPAREWLAPLIRRERVAPLLREVLPGVEVDGLAWQPVHPRAFRRAMKPVLIFVGVLTAALAFTNGWLALTALVVLLPWLTFTTRKHVQHLGWVEGDEVVLMKSGWIWRQVTVARINRIQAVAMHQSPFDRRAAMARVRVDTAGAGELTHRVDIPYLDHTIAQGLVNRLSAAAASTAFRW